MAFELGEAEIIPGTVGALPGLVARQPLVLADTFVQSCARWRQAAPGCVTGGRGGRSVHRARRPDRQRLRLAATRRRLWSLSSLSLSLAMIR